MSRGSTAVITKRDGSAEPFSLPKLHRCVAALLESCEFDVHLASPLAQAVATHIQQWDDPVPPTSRYIYDCVRAVLSQTGLGMAAERLRLRQDQRRRARSRLSVFEPDLPGAAVRLWDKGRLVRTLTTRYGLGQAVARFLAGEIENRVFALNYQRVSAELVAALLRNELAAWGLLEDRPAVRVGEAEPRGAARQRGD